MKQHHARLTELSATELENLQREADELATLQAFLNKLPLGLQVERLSNEELDRLRTIMRDPAETLCGSRLLAWNNTSRRLCGLDNSRSDISS